MIYAPTANAVDRASLFSYPESTHRRRRLNTARADSEP
jgi:hypothetical protein